MALPLGFERLCRLAGRNLGHADQSGCGPGIITNWLPLQVVRKRPQYLAKSRRALARSSLRTLSGMGQRAPCACNLVEALWHGRRWNPMGQARQPSERVFRRGVSRKGIHSKTKPVILSHVFAYCRLVGSDAIRRTSWISYVFQKTAARHGHDYICQ